MRGQSNFGNRATLTGSVLVSDIVYPLRPWNAPPRCSTLVPRAGSMPRALVVPALPVEGDLERVLDRQRAAVDEEQVRQGRVAEHAGEGLDEARHRHRVDVGVARLVDRDRGDLRAERRRRRPARRGSCRARTTRRT